MTVAAFDRRLSKRTSAVSPDRWTRCRRLRLNSVTTSTSRTESQHRAMTVSVSATTSPETPSGQGEAEERHAVEKHGEQRAGGMARRLASLLVVLFSCEAAEHRTEHDGQTAGGQRGETEDQGDEEKEGNPSIERYRQPLSGSERLRHIPFEPRRLEFIIEPGDLLQRARRRTTRWGCLPLAAHGPEISRHCRTGSRRHRCDHGW